MKSIIITGAAGNLGRVVTKYFAQNGYKIYAALGLGENSRHFKEEIGLADIDTQFVNLADETIAEGFVKGIIAKDKNVEAAICLVGGWEHGLLTDTRAYHFEKMMNLNFYTAFNVARPLMDFFERERNSGQFIFISARPAIVPLEAINNVAYSMSKSMVLRLAEIINAQGEPHNIKASVIVPSLIDTANNRAMNPDANPADFVSPLSIAETIEFLISEKGDNFRETVVKMYSHI